MDDIADVCIVGSGAGGSVLASELTRAGISVVILERGSAFRYPEDCVATRADFELARSPMWLSTAGYEFTGGDPQPVDPRFSHLQPEFGDTALPSLSDGDAVRRVRRSQQLQMAFGVGGTTVIFEGQATRYGNETFSEKSIDGVGADWPLGYQELEGDYAAVEDILGVAGDLALPGPPRKGRYPCAPHALCDASKLVAAGCRKHGLRLYPQAVSAPTVPYRGRPACLARCSSCMLGCPSRAKGSADVCFVEPAARTGRLDLRTGCTCLRLLPDRRGKVGGVVYRDGGGQERQLGARVVALAAGAIETPRILLASACGGWPNGMANKSGMVGRNYQETLTAVSWGLVDEPIASSIGLAIDNVVMDYARTRKDTKYARGFTMSSGVAGMNLVGPVSYALQVAPGWGKAHEDFMRQWFGKAIVLQAAGEQLPAEHNRVDLDPRKKDCAGEPVARVTNRLGENDLLMLEAMIARLSELLEATGAVHIRHNNSSYVSRVGAEPRGTCRMGRTADTSAVNSWCRSHEIPNLYITDASVLVGGMHGNISLTIQALARRASRDVASRMARREL